MAKMLKKLKNKTGETIGETLVALLVSSLALVMLAGAITTSTGIITRSSAKIDTYYKNTHEALKEMDNTGKNVVLSGSDGVEIKIPVKYGVNNDLNNENPVIAFIVAP